MKQQIAQLLATAAEQLKATGFIPSDQAIAVMVDNTRDKSHGDLTSNLALILAKACRNNPRAVATALIAALPETPLVSKIEIAGPGFINFFLAGASSVEIVAEGFATASTLFSSQGRSRLPRPRQN